MSHILWLLYYLYKIKYVKNIDANSETGHRHQHSPQSQTIPERLWQGIMKLTCTYSPDNDTELGRK